MNPTLRRNARFFALQAIYEWEINETPLADLEADFLVNHLVKKKTDVDYFKDLLHGVLKNRDELDQEIKPLLNRPFEEVDPVELSILRLGIYELTHRLDTPYRVAINEYLELTKQFGSIEGFKFVNGILDQVAKKTRIVEMHADKKTR